MSLEEVNGVLLLDKPKGISSNLALQKAKRLFKAAKAGHSGSLDPIATGLLPICFGEATKFSRFLLEADKRYQTDVVLGIRTDSGDKEGKVISEYKVSLDSRDTLEKVLEQFRGPILQIPPMYSAIKHQGRPLYQLARQNIEVARAARPVTIHLLKVLNWEGHQLRLEIHASKGTYVRSLVDDIGLALGCGAHVVELRRLGAGHYRAEQMFSFEQLEALATSERQELQHVLLPVDSGLENMPTVMVSELSASQLYQGQIISVPEAVMPGWVSLRQHQQFLGIGEVLEGGRIAPRRLLKRVVSF